MKMYKVCSENFEIKVREQRDYTTDEIIDEYDNRFEYFPSELFSSESLEEAEAFFEKQKETCSTCYSKNFHCRGWTLETGVVYLSEEEEHEDDIFIDRDFVEIYAEPITVYSDEDEEDDEEDEE